MYVSGPKVMVVSVVFIVRQTRVVAHSFCYFSEMPFFLFSTCLHVPRCLPLLTMKSTWCCSAPAIPVLEEAEHSI